MLFSSLTFLYTFLPLTLLVYALLPARMRNAALLAASLVFYFSGEPVYILLMAGETLAAYLFGLWMSRAKSERARKAALVLSVSLALAALLVFKYADLAVSTVNAAAGLSLPLPRLALPIGISFYTFQMISYTVDVYRRDAEAERSLVSLGAYITMFPQLIAGPIVRYGDVAAALRSRSFGLPGVAAGLKRFIAGLSKKVLLANVLGGLTAAMKAAEAPSVLGCWLIAAGYLFQIYFDFSGYSDMAIGLGLMLGFEFPENFNYPYTAKSITDFWRRWHMTLSRWFRDYVYIPLGGSRRGMARWLMNLFIVWGLTGLWHGASWIFALWGLYFAVLLSLEKLFLLRLLERAPAFIGHVYTLLAVLLGFTLFQSETLSEAAFTVSGMFGGGLALYGAESLYALRSYGLVLALAAVFSTPLARKLWTKAGAFGMKPALEAVCLVAGLLLSTAYLVDGSFNPFLYFRF